MQIIKLVVLKKNFMINIFLTAVKNVWKKKNFRTKLDTR